MKKLKVLVVDDVASENVKIAVKFLDLSSERTKKIQQLIDSYKP